MEIPELSEKSQAFLGRVINNSDIQPENNELFERLETPLKLNKKQYEVHFIKRVLPYLPNKNLQDYPILYTFFVCKPAADIKTRFLGEVEKKSKNEKFDADIIGSYYADFMPGFKEFDRVSSNMGDLLNTIMYKDKGFEFVKHTITITRSYDFAVVFIELNSVRKFLGYTKEHPDTTFEPAIN